MSRRPRHLPVLCTAPRSIYLKLGADCYDKSRDALSFNKPVPVIAHPPCRRFSKMRGLTKAPGSEEEIAYHCLEHVQKYGGILEHPRSSLLWKKLTLHAGSNLTTCGGMLISVNASWFGHPAEKKTCFYINGITQDKLPSMPYSLTVPTRTIGKSLTKHGRSPKKACTPGMNNHTPWLMALWLLFTLELITEEKIKL